MSTRTPATDSASGLSYTDFGMLLWTVTGVFFYMRWADAAWPIDWTALGVATGGAAALALLWTGMASLVCGRDGNVPAPLIAVALISVITSTGI